MGAVANFRQALADLEVEEAVVGRILAGYEAITDRASKPRRAAFFRQAVSVMDTLLDAKTTHAIRDACACSKGGWRLKAVQKVAATCAGQPLTDQLAALREITHMGRPILNADGTITAGIGPDEGCLCACPVFDGLDQQEPVSLTYCYCCAGHFRFHYQIALGRRLATREVTSSALASAGAQPCRFVYELLEE